MRSSLFPMIYLYLSFFSASLFGQVPGYSQTYTSEDPAGSEETEKAEKDSSANIFQQRISDPKIKEELKAARAKTLQNLPGGVYRAPKLHRQVMHLLQRYQRTDLVDSDVVFEVFFASTPEINGWISKPQSTAELKVFHVVLTLGLIDAICGYAGCTGKPSKSGGEYSSSLAMLGAVLGHELGHAMNGDLENLGDGIRAEFNADTFSVKLNAAAGLDPAATIHLLTLLGNINNDPSLSRLVAKMLDAHPRENFRIANVQPTVAMLKVAENEQGKRLTYGRARLDRSGPEKASRTSKDGFLKYKESEQYKTLGLTNKLKTLERYLAFYQSASTDVMSVSLYVVMTLEYSSLLKSIQAPEELNLLIRSLSSFEKQISQLAGVTSTDGAKNIKFHLRQLKHEILSKQLDLLGMQDLLPETMREWAGEVDRPFAIGALIRQVSRAESVDQLKQVMDLLYVYNSAIRNRHNSTKTDEEIDNTAFLYEAAAVRYLHLTRDLSKTLDFVHEIMPLEEAPGKVKPGVGFSQIMAGIVQYCLMNEGLYYGDFHDRMANPRTASDRNFAGLLFAKRPYVTQAFFKRRGLGESPDPQSRTFSYNVGRRPHGAAKTNPNVILLLNRAITENGISIIFNDLVKAFYTLDETLDLLATSDDAPTELKNLRGKILITSPSKQTRELQAQLKVIEMALRSVDASHVTLPILRYTVKEHLKFIASISDDKQKQAWEQLGPRLLKQFRSKGPFYLPDFMALAESHIRDQAGDETLGSTSDGELRDRALHQLSALQRSYQDLSPSSVQRFLSEFSSRTDAILTENVMNLHREFVTAPYYRQNGYKEYSAPKAPTIARHWYNHLKMKDRIELLSRLFEARAQYLLDTYGEPFAKVRPNLLRVLEELGTDGKLPEAAQKEFLQAYDGYVEQIVSMQESKGNNLTAEYFSAQRVCRDLFELLEQSSAKLSKKLAQNDFSVVSRMLHFAHRLTDPTHGRPLVDQALALDRQEALAMLQHEGHEALVSEKLSGLSSLADLILKYEGLSNADIAPVFDRAGKKYVTVNHIFVPGLPAPYHKSGVRYEHYLRTSAIFTKHEKKEIIDLGAGFQQFVHDEIMRNGEAGLENYLIHRRVKSFWPLHLQRAAQAEDSQSALIHTLGFLANSHTDSSEEAVRMHYVLLSRALRLVTTERQMQEYTALFARYLTGHRIGPHHGLELLNADISKLMDVSTLRYRQHYFDSLLRSMQRYDVEGATPRSLQDRAVDLKTAILIYLGRKADQYQRPYNLADSDRPYIFRTWVLKNNLLPLTVNLSSYQKWWEKIQLRLGAELTRTLGQQDANRQDFSLEKFYLNLRENTPFSDQLDQALAEHIYQGKFENAKLSDKHKRAEAIALVQKIRSPVIRDEVYQHILKTYGDLKVGWLKRVKYWMELHQAYQEAKELWTADVLDQLGQAQSELELFKISERAWEDHVKRRCTKLGIAKILAYRRLVSLQAAKQRTEDPHGAEVKAVVPEGSKYRDGFLEAHAKKVDTTFEDLTSIERFKSDKAKTPYHKLAKILFEFLDEHVNRLDPIERAYVALYLADLDNKLPSALEEKLSRAFHGSKNRRKSIKNRGIHIELNELKQYFRETHIAERALAFQAMFAGNDGVTHHPEAENVLVQRLVFADQQMPAYLKSVLKIYVTQLDSVDRSLLLSSLLANSEGQDLGGPDVLRMIVENSGAVAAKLAQLIASHGFHLPEEYQLVLEKFKGKAQEVDKIQAMKWISRRLPEDKYRQIKSLGRELGSGSLKLAYEATLRDGRKVVIKLGRDFAQEKLRQELDLLHRIIAEVQNDAQLRLEGLENLGLEVERILVEEMKFAEEALLEKAHREAYLSRPLLLRWFGSRASVYHPQPLPGWQADGILVEEFVEAKSWNDLPDRGMGWTKGKLAKAAIDEVLMQLTSVLNDGERTTNGNIVIDIDPHEENQLARRSRSGRPQMVNIDLGQSVRIGPEVVKGMARVIYEIDRGRLTDAALAAAHFVDLTGAEKQQIFADTLSEQAQIYQDPIEILSKTIEEVEIKGVVLKPEYLFFQKLIATLVGLKKHVNDPNYLINSTKRILVLRALSQPRQAYRTWKEFGNNGGKGCAAPFSAVSR